MFAHACPSNQAGNAVLAIAANVQLVSAENLAAEHFYSPCAMLLVP